MAAWHVNYDCGAVTTKVVIAYIPPDIKNGVCRRKIHGRRILDRM
jgi:hypothetical protein